MSAVGESNEEIREKLRGAREAAVREGERIEAERVKIANGTAEPVVDDALRTAYERAGEDPAELSETLTGYAESLVIEALGTARREGREPDAEAVGEVAAQGLRSAVQFDRDPGAKMRDRTALTARRAALVARPTARKPASIDLPALIRQANEPSLAVRVRRAVVGVTVFVAAVIGILAGLHALGAF